MSATQERDQAARIAGANTESALRLARNIDDPWFRCQALAHAAWHTVDDESFFKVINESLDSGWSIEIPNRAASVVAWPVAALAGRRLSGPAAMQRIDRMLREALARLTEVVAHEPSPISRADALLIHVHALSPSRPDLRKGILNLLSKECRDPANRKRQRQTEVAALVIARDDPRSALALATSLNEARRRRTLARIEQQPELCGPRSFFEAVAPPLK